MDAFEREADMSKEFRSGLKTKAGLFAGSRDWGEGATVVVVVGAKKRTMELVDVALCFCDATAVSFRSIEVERKLCSCEIDQTLNVSFDQLAVRLGAKLKQTKRFTQRCAKRASKVRSNCIDRTSPKLRKPR